MPRWLCKNTKAVGNLDKLKGAKVALTKLYGHAPLTPSLVSKYPGDWGLVPNLFSITQLDPNRHMIGWFFTRAHVLVDLAVYKNIRHRRAK